MTVPATTSPATIAAARPAMTPSRWRVFGEETRQPGFRGRLHPLGAAANGYWRD